MKDSSREPSLSPLMAVSASNAARGLTDLRYDHMVTGLQQDSIPSWASHVTRQKSRQYNILLLHCGR